ncbi:L-alanine exporter AlaE [Brenneria izbisi]|uniref:L-alanine exporter AlaE n=1 Tax=Brenneria izbisi TaxID=2939450 RepID=A0AA41XUE0_9GAMM|nr:L-alanine exporter AlaE [Brenneria izbisi]MCV9878403.1 L-alanine exporter AlaE [Brenneria izbisi]MCV9881826.1 L-alanine exporter AlaE [Brenneria izbisi]
MFSPASRLRSATADTFALVVYCFVTGMIIEIALSGMSLEQSLSSRLLSIPVNILIAWPYGIYRDRILRFAKRRGANHFIVRNLADLFAYVSFQSPVYVAILLAIGADSAQILAAVTSNVVISMMMGILYGYFLEYCRRLFRVAVSG